MALITIVPTILTEDPNRYKQLVELYHPFAKRVQIDISDGSLSMARTVPETSVWWPRGWVVDLHMMVVQPSAHLDTLVKLKPNLVIFHSEVQEDLAPTAEALRQNGIKVGVAIMKQTFPGSIKTLIEMADHAMIFSGNLGQTGGTADLLQLEKVRIIQKIKKDIEIGWDGGANINNVRTIAQAGVTVINVGNAIANTDNPAQSYAALVAEAEKQGVM
jgi:ribulose-phosphate 3-epimerase